MLLAPATYNPISSIMDKKFPTTLTSFVQLQTDDLDAFIADDELVLGLMEEFGVDTNAFLQLARQDDHVNPETLFHLLEQRWNGHGQVFSIEDQLPLLQHLIATSSGTNSGLEHLLRCGQATPIRNAHGPIRILFPDQCEEIAEAMAAFPKEQLQGSTSIDELIRHQVPPHFGNWQIQDLVSAPLWQLYDGLETFMQRAANSEAYVLIGTSVLSEAES